METVTVDMMLGRVETDARFRADNGGLDGTSRRRVYDGSGTLREVSDWEDTGIQITFDGDGE
jgi:hypothetical protein